MVSRYDIIYKGRSLALGYVSPHPKFHGHIVATVVPIEPSGKWEDDTLEIHFLNPRSDIFPDSKPELEYVPDRFIDLEDRVRQYKLRPPT
jgi:hypothetical protein